MRKKISVFFTIFSIIIGLAFFTIIYLLNGTVVAKNIEIIFYMYWMFTIAGYIIFIFNYDILKNNEDDFLLEPINLFIPVINICIFLIFVITLVEKRKEHKKIKESIKEKYKMTKKYPQLNSLNALKEVFETITFNSNADIEDSINKPLSPVEFKQMITFLESNYQEYEYSQLLIKYEFSFIKLLSIFRESISIENKISDDIFIPSNKLLRQFSNKAEAARNTIEKNELIEKERKFNIDNETKDKTKERFINEINEEIKFHENL
jgi:hypothetical protein